MIQNCDLVVLDPPPAVEYKDPNPVNGNAAHMAENSSEKPAIENGKNGVHVVPYDKQTEKVNGVKGEEDGEKKDEEKKEAAKEVGVLSLVRILIQILITRNHIVSRCAF